jgi:hypothetical protein
MVAIQLVCFFYNFSFTHPLNYYSLDWGSMTNVFGKPCWIFLWMLSVGGNLVTSRMHFNFVTCVIALPRSNSQMYCCLSWLMTRKVASDPFLWINEKWYSFRADLIYWNNYQHPLFSLKCSMEQSLLPFVGIKY